MATTAERLGIVETKVENLDEKLDHIQDDFKASHVEIKEQLKTMYEASCTQHAELANKISSLEKFKNKGTMVVMLLLAFGAGTGWIKHLDIPMILKFLGL